jgi:hypothetical protein
MKRNAVGVDGATPVSEATRRMSDAAGGAFLVLHVALGASLRLCSELLREHGRGAQ